MPNPTAANLPHGATFDPGDLKVISTAFKEAWDEVASHYSRKGLTAQSARATLAKAILAAAALTADRRDAESLKLAGLRALYEL
jgi:hypothetical protein